MGKSLGLNLVTTGARKDRTTLAGRELQAAQVDDVISSAALDDDVSNFSGAKNAPRALDFKHIPALPHDDLVGAGRAFDDEYAVGERDGYRCRHRGNCRR